MASTQTAEKQRRGRVRSDQASAHEMQLIGHNRMVPYLFSAPCVALVALILGFPVVYSIWQSFFKQDNIIAPAEFVGLENYRVLLHDPEFWDALARSGVFIGGCIVLGQVLAVAFAFLLNRLATRLRILRALTIVPYIVSSVAAAVMFRLFFNQEFGVPNRLLEVVGVDGLQWLIDAKLAMLVVIVAQVWTDLPLSILVILGGLQTIDQSHLDAAAVDGASGWKRMWHIQLPLIAPQLVLSTIWLSYSCLTAFGMILALTGGGPGTSTQTLPLQMYSVAFDRLELNEALAIANIILVINGLLTLVYLQFARRFGSQS